MFKGKKWTVVLIYIVAIFIATSMIYSSSVNAQISSFMFPPLSPFFNPFSYLSMPWGYIPFGLGAPFFRSYIVNPFNLESAYKIQFTSPEKFSVFSTNSLVQTSFTTPIISQSPLGLFSHPMLSFSFIAWVWWGSLLRSCSVWSWANKFRSLLPLHSICNEP